MATVCFDANVLIWGVLQDGGSTQQWMIEQAKVLIQQCADRKDSVLIPAVATAEAVCKAPLETQEGWFRVMTEHFMIAPYNARCAAFNARMWQEHPEVRVEMKDMGVPRQLIKIDFQILAVAVVNQCKVLYTEDKGLAHLAEKYQMEVRKVSEVQRQRGLFE